MTHGHALSPLDAAFIHVESESTPMHMATVGIFEGEHLKDSQGDFRLQDVRCLIASRLEQVPKLRQVASPGLLGEAPLVWRDDPDFDIAEHVRLRHLSAPGNEGELRRQCAQLLEVPLDRERPLWELTFIDGLSEQRVAVVEKLHHSMADGLAAAELATVLLDLSADPGPLEGERPWVPLTPQPVWRGYAEDLMRLGQLGERVMAWSGQGITHPIRRLTDLVRLGRGIASLATPNIFAPRSSLNRQITPSRSLDFVRLSFDQVHDVAHAHNATINDVLLTIVAGGMHELIKSRGELTSKTELQALVPVGLPHGRGDGIANSVSALFVRLPIGVSDPLVMLSIISAEVQRQKGQHQEKASSAFLQLLAPLPQSVLAAAAGIVQRQPFFNLIVTNVPGPPIPLYALGAKLIEAFPVVPLAGNQSVGVAALSYEGQLNLACSAIQPPALTSTCSPPG
jgi:diacylglycerol O-acyltransferase / wax synthase